MHKVSGKSGYPPPGWSPGKGLTVEEWQLHAHPEGRAAGKSGSQAGVEAAWLRGVPSSPWW